MSTTRTKGSTGWCDFVAKCVNQGFFFPVLKQLVTVVFFVVMWSLFSPLLRSNKESSSWMTTDEKTPHSLQQIFESCRTLFYMLTREYIAPTFVWYILPYILVDCLVGHSTQNRPLEKKKKNCLVCCWILSTFICPMHLSQRYDAIRVRVDDVFCSCERSIPKDRREDFNFAYNLLHDPAQKCLTWPRNINCTEMIANLSDSIYMYGWIAPCCEYAHVLGSIVITALALLEYRHSPQKNGTSSTEKATSCNDGKHSEKREQLKKFIQGLGTVQNLRGKTSPQLPDLAGLSLTELVTIANAVLEAKNFKDVIRQAIFAFNTMFSTKTAVQEHVQKLNQK